MTPFIVSSKPDKTVYGGICVRGMVVCGEEGGDDGIGEGYSGGESGVPCFF